MITFFLFLNKEFENKIYYLKSLKIISDYFIRIFLIIKQYIQTVKNYLINLNSNSILYLHPHYGMILVVNARFTPLNRILPNQTFIQDLRINLILLCKTCKNQVFFIIYSYFYLTKTMNLSK